MSNKKTKKTKNPTALYNWDSVTDIQILVTISGKTYILEATEKLEAISKEKLTKEIEDKALIAKKSLLHFAMQNNVFAFYGKPLEDVIEQEKKDALLAVNSKKEDAKIITPKLMWPKN